MVLNNIECLGNETQIKRLQIVSRNETLYVKDHSAVGAYCPVQEFDLVKGSIKQDDLPHDHPSTILHKNGGINDVVRKKWK